MAANIDLTKQGNETNCKNVKFEIYLEETDRNVKEKSAYINSEDMKMYLAVGVQGGGYLNNAQIELVNTNFRLKNNPELTKIKLDSIQTEKGIVAGLPIIAKKDESYNLSLLDMQSQIKLTGEYIDDKGNVTEIDTTKAIKIIWTASELVGEDLELKQEVITNKIYNIEGVNKRIVQILVTSKILNDKAPIKTKTIEIPNPEIGTDPRDVRVAGYSTKATNGKGSKEFGETNSSTWEYNQLEKTTKIEIKNNPNIENEIAWTKGNEDKLVITYIYDEETVISPFISNVKSIVELYGNTNKIIEKTTKIELGNLQEKGDIVTQETTTNNIYKGKMYIGEDTFFETKTNIYVPYSKLANKITVQDLGDKVFAREDEVVEGISTYYKTTKINKAEALKILGTEGTIKIYNADDRTAPIKEIVLSEEIEGDYYTFLYGENVNKIAIEMSPAIAEGTIEIINEKTIKTTNIDIAKTLTELKTNTNIIVVDQNDTTIVNSNIEKAAKLVEPKTDFNVSFDKKSLSALTENDVRITVELKAKDESNKLFKNPTINIELPKEIKELSIANITPVVGNDELTIKSYNVITNEAGNKVIVIQLQGEQTKYSTNVANIVIDTKMKTDAFMADTNAEIKATSINYGETAVRNTSIKITSKSGLVTKSTIKIDKNTLEKVNQSNINVNAKGNETIEINAKMINNYGEKLTGTTIIGNIPNGAILKSITPEIKNAVVYYSEEINPSIDSESWKTEVSSLDKIKSFKIVGAELEQGAVIAVNYKYVLNNETEKTQISTLKLTGTVAEKMVEDTLTYTANISETEKPIEPEEPEKPETPDAEKLAVQTIVTVGGEEIKDGAEINNGQVLRYRVIVKNTSNETLNNVKLTATIQNGVFYDLVEDEGMYYYDEETGKMLPAHKFSEVKEKSKTLIVESLEAGKTRVFEYQTVAYIGEENNANQFKNNILVLADNVKDISLNDTKIIKEGKIALKLHYASNEDPILYSDGNEAILAIDLRNLATESLQNVPIEINLPEGLYFNAEDQLPGNNIQMNVDNKSNKLKIKVDELKANSTSKVKIKLNTKSVPFDKSELKLELFATVDYGGKHYISNEYIRSIYQSKTEIEAKFTSDKMNQVLQQNDEITYTLTLTNNGILDTGILYIFDKVPDELTIKSISAKTKSGVNKEYAVDNDGNINLYDLELDVGDTLTLIIAAKADKTTNVTKEIANSIKISGSRIHAIEKSLVNVIDNNSNDGQINPQSISGLAWLDENKDGIRSKNEKILEAVEVLLLDKDGKQVEKTTTSLAGTYKFNNVEKGEYTVVFVYDTSKYAVTKYQVSEATESTNSDAISKQIEINGETKIAGATNTVKVDGKTINKDIDIGLIENAKFDLSLNKYVSKVILTNKAGTTTYEYESANLAKVEISARRIAGTVMLVEYDLQVTNEGDVDAYVEDVVDYLPDGLVFTSETNKDWYMDGNKVLHNKSIADQVIKPGETKTVTLVLTKTLKSDSTGTIENTGEIGASRNLLGITENDSTAGNKKAGEDDMSTASLIVSISTGSPIMYIGIVIGTMAVLGLGIYIINKKVLKVRI